MRAGLIVAAAAVLIAGCDSPQPTPPPAPNPAPTPPPGAERITGSERLGWSQQAGNGEELATFRYLIYVDNTAADAQDVTCSATAGPAGFACTARMPSMSAGPHALALSSYIDSSGSRLESPRSPAVNVILVAQTNASDGDSRARAGGSLTLRDGVRLFSEIVADGFDAPRDLALIDEDRILVAERDGRIRAIRGRRLNPAPAIALSDVDVARGGLLSIAAERRDGRPPFLFVLYTTVRGFRLARFTVVEDTLGDRAIFLDEIPSSGRASGFVRIGPDHRLYVGLDNGGDARLSGDRGSFSGKVLRLNADGTTPADQPSGSPIVAADVTSPRGEAWTPDGTPWLLDVNGDIATVQSIARSTGAAPRYRLPDGSRPSAIAVYGAQRPAALRGNVLIAAPGTQSILRLVPAVDPERIASTERLHDEAFDGITAAVVAADGTIYLATAHALLRLMPR